MCVCVCASPCMTQRSCRSQRIHFRSWLSSSPELRQDLLPLSCFWTLLLLPPVSLWKYQDYDDKICVHHHIWLFYTGFGIKLGVWASRHCLCLAISPMSLTSFFKVDYELSFCQFSNHYLWQVPMVSGEQSMWDYGKGRMSFLKTTVITSPSSLLSGEPGAQIRLHPAPTPLPCSNPWDKKSTGCKTERKVGDNISRQTQG